MIAKYYRQACSLLPECEEDTSFIKYMQVLLYSKQLLLNHDVDLGDWCLDEMEILSAMEKIPQLMGTQSIMSTLLKEKLYASVRETLLVQLFHEMDEDDDGLNYEDDEDINKMWHELETLLKNKGVGSLMKDTFDYVFNTLQLRHAMNVHLTPEDVMETRDFMKLLSRLAIKSGYLSVSPWRKNFLLWCEKQNIQNLKEEMERLMVLFNIYDTEVLEKHIAKMLTW